MRISALVLLGGGSGTSACANTQQWPQTFRGPFQRVLVDGRYCIRGPFQTPKKDGAFTTRNLTVCDPHPL